MIKHEIEEYNKKVRNGYGVDKLNDEKAINRYEVSLLGIKLADIVYCLTQVDEYEYIEQLFEDLHQQIEAGYQIIEQYEDWEVENE